MRRKHIRRTGGTTVETVASVVAFLFLTVIAAFISYDAAVAVVAISLVITVAVSKRRERLKQESRRDQPDDV